MLKNYFKSKFCSIENSSKSSGFSGKKLEKPTIVIVDDDESCNVSLRLMLHDLNLNIISFTQGTEALNYILANGNKIKLVLLDLMMPDLNGLDIIKKIKSHKAVSHIPLILQTGMTERKFLDEGFENGMTDYILKPYVKNTIIKVIQDNLL